MEFMSFHLVPLAKMRMPRSALLASGWWIKRGASELAAVPG